MTDKGTKKIYRISREKVVKKVIPSLLESINFMRVAGVWKSSFFFEFVHWCDCSVRSEKDTSLGVTFPALDRADFVPAKLSSNFISL